jgi:RNA polymerase sigma-70 factor, ECF subfamily
VLTDAQLMQQVQAGQSGLFDELIVRHRPGLLRFAGSILSDSHAAEDAVQEALLAAFAARAMYNPQFAFSTWVYTILLNVCRRQRRRSQAASTARCPFKHVAAMQETPLDRLLHSETREQLNVLLDELPDVEADALRLRFFAGLQFDEIAVAMDSSLTGAKVRVRRGLERLAERLRRDGHESDDLTSTPASTSVVPHSRRTMP